jgi:hypothetical protein
LRAPVAAAGLRDAERAAAPLVLLRGTVFGAVLLRVLAFPAAVAFLAEVFRLVPAAFRVDLVAFRAPPRAVLRTDDLDRLLDDALRLAMSVSFH